MTNDNLTVGQRYANIIDSSTSTEDTEEALKQFLSGNTDFYEEQYYRLLAEIESSNTPKGFHDYDRTYIEKYKPVMESREFIAERRVEAIKGNFKTELEVRVYVTNKFKEKGFSQEHEYYDSTEYEKDYDKIRAVFKSAELPAPLTGIIPDKDLKKFLKPGDILFIKQDTRSVSMNPTTSSLDVSQNPGYHVVKGGEVLKVNIKNVKTRVTGEYWGKPYDHEASIPLIDITHVIRDGKRYRVDDSNELV